VIHTYNYKDDESYSTKCKIELTNTYLCEVELKYRICLHYEKARPGI